MLSSSWEPLPSNQTHIPPSLSQYPLTDPRNQLDHCSAGFPGLHLTMVFDFLFLKEAKLLLTSEHFKCISTEQENFKIDLYSGSLADTVFSSMEKWKNQLTCLSLTSFPPPATDVMKINRTDTNALHEGQAVPKSQIIFAILQPITGHQDLEKLPRRLFPRWAVLTGNNHNKTTQAYRACRSNPTFAGRGSLSRFWFLQCSLCLEIRLGIFTKWRF